MCPLGTLTGAGLLPCPESPDASVPGHPLPAPPRSTGRPPSPCFQRSPHSCHLRRSVGKSSPHEVIHMEHHICRIFILTRVRASAGCRQSLCLTRRQLPWGFLPRGQQRPGGAGLSWGPLLELGGSVGPPSELWVVGEPAGSAPTSLDAPMSSQLWAAACSVIFVGGQPERRNHTTRGISTENLTQGTGDTGVEGLKRRKEDTRVAERSRLRGALHTPGPRKRSGLLNGRGLADEGPTELGARSRRSGLVQGWCRECGEKTEAGERSHWGDTHETKQISWRQRGAGSSCQETELWGQAQEKVLSLCMPPYPAPPHPPGQPGQPPHRPHITPAPIRQATQGNLSSPASQR